MVLEINFLILIRDLLDALFCHLGPYELQVCYPLLFYLTTYLLHVFSCRVLITSKIEDVLEKPEGRSEWLPITK